MKLNGLAWLQRLKNIWNRVGNFTDVAILQILQPLAQVGQARK